MAEAHLDPPVNQMRRGSLAQTDVSKYRKAFDSYSDKKDGTIKAQLLKDVAEKVGYRISETHLQVCEPDTIVHVCALFMLY